MVKRLLSIGAAVVMGVCLFCGLVTLTGCDQMILSTTNERLDETERQLTYRSNAINYYSLEKAYANSWLTQTDIAYAMFYAKGKVYTCKKSDWNSHNTEKIKEIDFAPTEVCPAINEQVEIDIKRYYYDRLSFEEGLDFEEFAENVMFEFVGSYNGTFVITNLESIYWGYSTDVPPPVYIAGFVWSGSYANDLFVFRYE